MKNTVTIKEEQHPIDSSILSTVHLGNHTSVRLYRDSSPSYLEIAPLQKGLVLMFDDKELIEEGIGFGVPVVKFKDKTFFSSSAMSSIQENNNHCMLVKSFVLDTISRKRVWRASYVNDRFYSFFHKLFERAYLGHKSLSSIFNRIMEMRRALRVHTEFIKVKPRGRITVEYLCQPGIIKINVDLSSFERAGCQEVLILNEQGSTFFRKYSDAYGLKLFDEKIGAWEKVGAGQASLSDTKETLKFSLRNIDDGTLFRGWEETKGRFSWAGLSYSLNKELFTFDYLIRLYE